MLDQKKVSCKSRAVFSVFGMTMKINSMEVEPCLAMTVSVMWQAWNSLPCLTCPKMRCYTGYATLQLFTLVWNLLSQKSCQCRIELGFHNSQLGIYPQRNIKLLYKLWSLMLYCKELKGGITTAMILSSNEIFIYKIFKFNKQVISLYLPRTKHWFSRHAGYRHEVRG